MAALWPSAVVTDDSLVQCVGDLRVALGNSGQRLIRTVQRRGYRFECAVEALTGEAPRVAGPEPSDADVARPQPGPAAQGDDPARSARRWRHAPIVILAVAGILIGAVFASSRLRPVGIDEELARRHTIAVMPFASPVDDPALRSSVRLLADAIAAEITTHLGMRGIGTGATAAFDEPTVPLARIGKDLKASYVVSGKATALATGGYAVDVQAMAVADGSLLWSQRFEVGEGRGAVTGSDVAQVVTSALRGRIFEIDSHRAMQQGYEPDGADLTMLGWYAIDLRGSPVEMRRAQAWLRQALQKDSESVLALNGFAASTLVLAGMPGSPISAAERMEAEHAVDRSMQLAPNDATGAMLWSNFQISKGRPDLALPAIEKAIRIVPSFPNGHVLRAQVLVLLGRTGEVNAEVDQAVRLAVAGRDSPRVSFAYLAAAEAALMRGDDAEAHRFAELSIAERPSTYRAHAVLAASDALMGRSSRAAAEMAEFQRLWPEATVARFDESRPSTNPAFLAQRARLYEGLRKAGLPER
jgi:TolB-like protein